MIAWERAREAEINSSKKVNKVVGTWKTIAMKEIHRKEVSELTTKIDTVRTRTCRQARTGCADLATTTSGSSRCHMLCCGIVSSTPSPFRAASGDDKPVD